jgi:hypothetical protein
MAAAAAAAGSPSRSNQQESVFRSPVASAAPASTPASRPWIDLSRARVQTLSVLPKLFSNWTVNYTNVVHLPRRRAGPSAATSSSHGRPSLLIAATGLYSHAGLHGKADDLVMRHDLLNTDEDNCDDFLPGWNRADTGRKREPEELLVDERNGALLIGGEGGIWIETGVAINGVPTAAGAAQLNRVGLPRKRGETSPLESSLSVLRLQTVHELLDAKAGDGSFIINECARAKNKKETVLSLVRGDVFSNPHVATIYLAQKYDCEFFTPLTRDRLIVQTGENGRWTEEVLIDYSKLKHLGRPITREDIQSVWDERKPLKFKNGVKLNSNAIVQVREHELVIAEETRTHTASFEITADGIHITVHQSLGCGIVMEDGSPSTASFCGISLMVPISLGAMLLIDVDLHAGSWHRLMYDDQYEYAHHVDRWSLSPSAAMWRTTYNEQMRMQADEDEPPAAAATSSTPSSRRRRKRARTQQHRDEEDAQQDEDEDEQADMDGDWTMANSSAGITPPRLSAKKRKAGRAAAASFSPAVSSRSSSSAVPQLRPIAESKESMEIDDQPPAASFSPSIPSFIGAAAASSSTVSRSVCSPPPSTAAAASARCPSPSTPALSPRAALAAPASSLSDFQHSRSIIDAEELEDKRRIAESDHGFARRAVIRAHTRGVFTAKEQTARVIEEAQRELQETISQLDEVRARALQEADARRDCQLRAIDAEMLLHRTQ